MDAAVATESERSGGAILAVMRSQVAVRHGMMAGG
jgi:hypothetical protein